MRLEEGTWWDRVSGVAEQNYVISNHKYWWELCMKDVERWYTDVSLDIGAFQAYTS